MKIDDVLRGLERFEHESIASARAGLVEGMEQMEETAKTTSTYSDQTGANRAGTVGYVPGTNDDRFAEAVAAVEEKRPGASEVISVPGDPDGLTGLLTTPTTYARNLERNNAGQRAYLEPALIQDMQGVTATIAQAIKEQRG